MLKIKKQVKKILTSKLVSETPLYVLTKSTNLNAIKDKSFKSIKLNKNIQELISSNFLLPLLKLKYPVNIITFSRIVNLNYFASDNLNLKNIILLKVNNCYSIQNLYNKFLLNPQTIVFKFQFILSQVLKLSILLSNKKYV